MKSDDSEMKQKGDSLINKLTLSFQNQRTEEKFLNQKLSNKKKIAIIDAIGMSLIYLITGVKAAIDKDIFLAILYMSGLLYLNTVTLIGRKYSKLFQPSLFIHLLTQMIIFTEIIGPKLSQINQFDLHLILITLYVRHSYFLSIMDSWSYRLVSLIMWMYYPLRHIESTSIEKYLTFLVFFIQMLWIFYFDNKAERMWFIDQCSIKEDLQFWKTLFNKNLQSVVFVISVPKQNDIQVEFCNAQGLKDFKAKNKSDFQHKILNDFHINLFENRQYQLFKDFIYQKYIRQQQQQNAIPSNIHESKSDFLDTPAKEPESAKNKNASNISGIHSPDSRLDEHIYMNSFYIDPKSSTKYYYDVKLVNCSWKNQFAIMAFLTNVPQNNIVNRLQKINQYKDELLATVSHDLKTPLNAMIQVVQTAMNECTNEVYTNYFDIIDKNSKLLLNIINDILDYSQILKGKLRLTHQIFSIRQVIQEVHDLLKYQFQDKGIDFLIDIQHDIQVQNDQNRLKQILNNIIGNALKFTFKGYVKVKVIPIHDNQSISISVEDTGTGIDTSLQPKLFQLYSTFDHNKGSNKHGVGLGLAICKKLVQLMGPQDSIQLFSEKGKGSKFIFEIYQNLDISKANQKTKSALFESRRSLDNSSLIYSPEYKKPNSLNLFHHSNSMNNQDLVQSFVINQQFQQIPGLLQQQSTTKHTQSILYNNNNAVSTFSHMNSNTNFTTMKSHNPVMQTTNSQQTNTFTNYGISAPSLTGYLPLTFRQNILNGIIENNEEGNYLESEKQLPFSKKMNEEINNNVFSINNSYNNNSSNKTPVHKRLQQVNMNIQFKNLSQNEINDDQSKSSERTDQNTPNNKQINSNSHLSNLSKKINMTQHKRNNEEHGCNTPVKKQYQSLRHQTMNPKSLQNIEESAAGGDTNDISPHFPLSNPNSIVESEELLEFKRDEDFNDLKGHMQNNYTFIEQKKYHILENYVKQHLKRILIVDDTPFNIRALKIVLENVLISSSSVEILQAFNGQQSIEVLEKCFEDNKQVDIIFMDINMPVMDGYEATKKIRTMHQFDSTKIIFATAYSEYSNIWKQNKTGADGYLQKPIQRTDLLRILKDLSLQVFNQQNRSTN